MFGAQNSSGLHHFAARLAIMAAGKKKKTRPGGQMRKRSRDGTAAPRGKRLVSSKLATWLVRFFFYILCSTSVEAKCLSKSRLLVSWRGLLQSFWALSSLILATSLLGS